MKNANMTRPETMLMLAALTWSAAGCAIDEEDTTELSIAEERATEGDTVDKGADIVVAPRVALGSIPLVPRAQANDAPLEALRFETDDSEVVRVRGHFDPDVAAEARVRAEWQEALR